MKVPITQSLAWKKLQDYLGEKNYFQKGNGYQFLAILKKTPVGNYLYLPYGPVADDKKGYQNALKTLNILAEKTHADFLRIEPQSSELPQLFSNRVRKSHDLNPKDTWILDLSPDKATLISNFSQGTRTRYNTFTKKGLSVERTNNLADISHLVALQNKLFKTKNLHAHSADYLMAELSQPFATLYLVKYHTPSGATKDGTTPKDGQVLAASLFFDYRDTRYYMQSAADTEFRKLPATVALLSTAIFDAKEKGIRYFDFWGIAPDGAPKDHPWQGFTEFKKSFGGYAKHYAGTYDIILKPFKYRLYQIMRKINRILRRA